MRRRSFLAAAVLTAACGRTVAPADRIGPLEDKYNAVVGMYALNLDSGQNLNRRDGEMLAVCSTFKAYLSARVLQLAQEGSLALTETLYVDPDTIVTHSPLTQPHAGGRMELAALCEATLQQSDNTAANLLLQRIGGPPAITAFARSIGDEKTRLDRWETDLNSAIPGDPRDTSTPRALGEGFRTLLTGDVLDQTHRRRLEDWMRGNSTSSMRAGLPQGWTSADKTGAGDYGSTNDIGIAYGPAGERILLAVMTRSRSDDPKAANLQPLIGEITAAVLPSLLG